MADEVWIDVLPSMKGFGVDLVKGAMKSGKEAGQKAGKEYSAALKSGTDGASDAMVAELEAAQKKASGLVVKLSGDVSKARQAQASAAANLITAEQRLADAVAKFGAESAQAQAATLKLEAARLKAADADTKFKNTEDALKSAQNANKTATEQLTTAQKAQEKALSKSNNETKKAPGLWGKLGGAMGKAGGKVKAFSKTAGGLATKLAGAAGGAALLTEAFGAGLEKETVADRLNAALAATPEQAKIYGAAAGNLFSAGMGETMGDVGNAVDSVVSSMGGMRDASQQEIEKITGYAMNLAKAFDVDVAESATTAGSLIKNGLANDAEHAMDLITGAMNQVPKSLRGEVLPVMDEYGKHFQALGIDGETAMGMIVASSADGAIGMDKMGDALKEFTIRATDMSKTTSGAYDTLGLDMTTMTNELLAGGDRAEGAMGKIIHGLQGIKDPGEQAAASLALFGTPLEDLGTDQIPNFLGMVDPMGEAFKSLDGSAGTLGTTLNDNTATSLEVVKRSFSTMISDGIEPALGPLNSVLTWATETPGVMTAVAVVLGLVALAWAAVTLAASPWLALGVGIAIVIGGIILAVNNWGVIMEWLGETWGNVTSWISEKWGEAVTGIKQWWDDTFAPIIKGVKDRIEEAKQKWSTSVSDIENKWAETVQNVKEWWDTTLSPVIQWFSDRIQDAKNTWQSAVDIIKEKWQNLSNRVKEIYDTVFRPMFDAFGKLLTGDFVGAWESAKESVRGIWNQVKGIAAKPINFVIDTVYNNGLRKAINKVRNIVGGDDLPEIDGIPAFAKGGLHKGGWALVGEEGPELVNFSAPGRVYTANETSNMLAGNTQAPEGALTTLDGSKGGEPKLPIGGWIGDAFGWVKDKVSDAWGAATDWVRGGLAKAAGFVLNPLKGWINDTIPNTGLGKLASGAATQTIDKALTWISGKDQEALADGGPMFYDGALGAFAKPANGPITSGFGASRGRWPHAGIDFAVGIGSAVRSMLNGVVRKIGWNAVPGRSGKGMVVDHAQGMSSYYGHLSAWGKKPGDEVKAGERIASSGNTGRSTGPHLHAELWRNGTPFNFRSYLYDQGGVVAPGVTTVVNKTGKPERVLTPSQNENFERIANDRESNRWADARVTAQELREALAGMELKLQTEAGIVIAKLVNKGLKDLRKPLIIK